MTKQPDDLEAVRKLVDALQSFAHDDQERIIRWAREKLGLVITPPAAEPTASVARLPTAARPLSGPTNLREFVALKDPQSDIQFAATVAYFYRFEAADGQRKETVKATDLQEACRLADRRRLKDPLKTLNNAHRDGLLDRGPDRGTFVINSVGENLVAMALPGAGTSGAGKRRLAAKPRGRARKKK
jgi:hypothetical protein